MRRALTARMPALAFHFHLMPWQLELLTMPELEAFLTALQDLSKTEG